MEATKIPKASGLKPPSKLPASTRHLGTIHEKKPIPGPSSSGGSGPPPPQYRRDFVLRRRSKSATDLRPTSTKLSAFNGKTGPAAPVAAKTAKRPLEGKVDSEPKPKVAKTKKIPDWDYKSRFQDLQQRHTTVVTDMKNYRAKWESLQQLESQVVKMQADNENLHKENTSLKASVTELTGKYNKAKTELTDLTNRYSNLKSTHDNLEEEYQKIKEHADSLEKENMEMISKYEDLTNKYNQIKITKEQIEQELEEQENLRRILHNTIQDLKGNIRVFCRVRPPISADERDKLQCSMIYPDESTVEIRKSRDSVSITGKPTDLRQEFVFDKVFPPEAKQEEVFEELSQLVQSALDGYHVCVFAYGQTGSGKTYTMQGTQTDQGMIPRTIELIFQKIAKLVNSGWSYDVFASFLEIYNETIKDLLAPNSILSYEPRFNEGRGVTVTNLKTVNISSAMELKNYMEEAQRNRAVATTDFNLHSSRSHSITKISLEGYNKQSQVAFSGSIHLVDLAGSESAKTSSAIRLTETKNINRSLTELGMVMLALHNKDGHVPYRNSKLTYLLQSCLGGNSKTLMFVNIAPFEECYAETINSLRFAARVKEVKMTAKKNKTYSASASS